MKTNSLKKYYLIYKTTNLINGKIYIGAHETNNLDDGYLGSGKYFHYALNKYGRENFKREILFELSSREEMFQKEKEIVNEEFIKREDTYNIKLGGDGGFDHLKGCFTVVDREGNHFSTSKNDPRYISGEVVSIVKGKGIYVNEIGETKFFDVTSNIPKGYIPFFKKYGVYADISGNRYFLDRKDKRVISGELKSYSASKGTVSCIDKNGGYHFVSPDDPRIESGEFVKQGIFLGRTLSEETRKKISEANKISLQGERNFFYGKHWMSNPETLEEKILSKEEVEEYTKLGWKLGRLSKRKNPNIKRYDELTKEEKEIRRQEILRKRREIIPSQKGKVFITNEKINKLLYPEEAEKLVSTGEWRYGRKYSRRRSTV